ncbi:hypothetical protein [Caldisericum exile]|uniref:hypothetical protein n=1 Tax=Caldisericum exile TaxID=693075 RepID=UPI003C775F82
MRKTIFLTAVKFLLIIILISIMSISIFPSKSFLRGKSVNDDTLIINALSETVRDWYYQQRSKTFKNVVVNVSLMSELPHSVENGKAEAVFAVNAKMIPTVTIEEVEKSPFLGGMRRYLKENKKNLSNAQIKTAELKIKDWHNELTEPIGKPTEENVVLKIVCEVTSTGSIKNDTVKIFYDVSGQGTPIWKDATNLFPSTALSPKEEEGMGYEEVKNLLEKLYPANSSSKEVSPTAYYENWYVRNNAKIYADGHTSEYPTDPNVTNWTIKCWRYDSQTGQWAREVSNGAMKDRNGYSIWNMSQYSLSPVTIQGETRYETLACNNCADFVSQAMYHGGMLADGKWSPLYRKTAVGGKWYWTYVPHLLDYMRNTRGDWVDSNYNSTQNGDVIVWTDQSHIAMIDYNLYQNGTYTKKYAAHTTDSKQHYYSPAAGYWHYKVSCWRWTP